MKKSFIGVLTVSILSAMTISPKAEEVNQDTPAPQEVGTSIEFNVDPTYSVTIPTTIALSKQRDASYAGNGTIRTAAIRLHKDATIDVTIESDFEMTTIQGATQDYVVTVGDETIGLKNGATIAKFNTSETAQSVQLNYTAANPKYAGEYSDTVLFTIAMNANSK